MKPNTERVATNREAEAAGGLGLARVSTPAYNEFVQSVADQIQLGPDVIEYLVVEHGQDGTRAWVKAKTPSGNVSESYEIEVPRAVGSALDDLLDEHRDAVRTALKVGLTKTIAIGMTAPTVPPAED